MMDDESAESMEPMEEVSYSKNCTNTFEILTVAPLYRATLRHHRPTKFHQNRSNGCGDMAI